MDREVTCGQYSVFSIPFYGSVFLLLMTTAGLAQSVRVRLFEIFHPRRVEISAVQPSPHFGKRNLLTVIIRADTLSTDQCRIELTATALQIKSKGRVRSLPAGDTIHVITSAGQTLSPVKTLKRFYSGGLKIYALGKELCIVNLVSPAAYLAGILAAEMPHAERAALQAQAVVARTFVAKNPSRHAEGGYQFCDLTHCQTYKGKSGVTAPIEQAVADTKNEILVYQQQPIAAYYSSTCGGRTADDNGVWANQKDQPYLTSQIDSNFCASSPHYRWRVKISAVSLHEIWQRRLGAPINGIIISKKGTDGRVRELALMGPALHLISGEDFRAVTCRVLGWNTLKSTAFDLRIEKNLYIFTGRGLGHGLGLCQYGAMEMARRGYSHREILRQYFPGTQIEKYF